MPGAQEDDGATRETDDDAEGKALAEREAVLPILAERDEVGIRDALVAEPLPRADAERDRVLEGDRVRLALTLRDRLRVTLALLYGVAVRVGCVTDSDGVLDRDHDRDGDGDRDRDRVADGERDRVRDADVERDRDGDKVGEANAKSEQAKACVLAAVSGTLAITCPVAPSSVSVNPTARASNPARFVNTTACSAVGAASVTCQNSSGPVPSAW